MRIQIKNKLFLFVLLFVLPFWGLSQNCSSFISYNTPQFPYKYNGQSKSATCQSGRTYKFVITLLKGKEYKISFYASSIFDNKINFKIIDESTNDAVLDMPGQSDDENGIGSVLVAPTDPMNGKTGDYPSFDFFPVNSMNLRIEIDVAPAVDDQGNPDDRRGCVGVLIQEKKARGQAGF